MKTWLVGFLLVVSFVPARGGENKDDEARLLWGSAHAAEVVAGVAILEYDPKLQRSFDDLSTAAKSYKVASKKHSLSTEFGREKLERANTALNDAKRRFEKELHTTSPPKLGQSGKLFRIVKNGVGVLLVWHGGKSVYEVLNVEAGPEHSIESPVRKPRPAEGDHADDMTSARRGEAEASAYALDVDEGAKAFSETEKNLNEQRAHLKKILQPADLVAYARTLVTEHELSFDVWCLVHVKKSDNLERYEKFRGRISFRADLNALHFKIYGGKDGMSKSPFDLDHEELFETGGSVKKTEVERDGTINTTIIQRRDGWSKLIARQQIFPLSPATGGIGTAFKIEIEQKGERRTLLCY